jgi:hypothetical protein
MFDALLSVLLLLGPLIWLIPCFIVFIVTLILSFSMVPSTRRFKVRWFSVTFGVVLFSVILWDIPVLWEYKDRCKNEAGFFQYKTIEEWKGENPDVAETLESIENAKWKNDGSYTHVPLNQRFEWVFSEWSLQRGIRKREDRLVDVKTGEILARYIDFNSGMKNKGISPFNVRLYKVWLNSKSCPKSNKEKWLVDGDSFMNLRIKIQQL